MKYSNPNNTSNSIIHQFSSEGHHIIGGKSGDNVEMSFREVQTNSSNRDFMFSIRYRNNNDEYKLTQFSMNQNEIKQFLDIVSNTVNNPPKFKDDYKLGDKFLIPYTVVLESIPNNRYTKRIEYHNVEATITDICWRNEYFVLSFDGNTKIVPKDYLDGLKRIVN